MDKFELENKIKYNNELYWNGNAEISDAEYDKLIVELKQIDPENELLKEIGKPNKLSDEKLVKHSKKMLSLDKVYSLEDLLKWIRKNSRSKSEKFLIQPKYDGMSGLLENGILSSRGDGEYGQDYTDKLKIIQFDSDKKIDINNSFLLGEIVISNHDFNTIYKNIKSKSGIPFKNQRNGIAGVLGTDDIDFYHNQGAKITFVDYDINSYETDCENFENDWNNYSELIVSTSKYPLDGIVVKIKDKEYAESLGYTSHHPKSQIAFKFTNQTANSKLLDVEWSMGKKQISAIGIIEPVEISGITIKRVKLQLTKPKNTSVKTCLIDGSLQIGDNIVIERAGDIIPHMISSTPGENRIKVELNKCPFCGSDLIINDSSIQCNAKENRCIEAEIQELYNSVVTIGIKNVGEAYIRTLVTDKNINVKNIADLFELKQSDLVLKEYGDRKKEILFEEIEKAKNNVTKYQLLSSVNLDNIGKTVSKLLVDNFDWNDIIEGKISKSQLLSINGIGETIAESYKKLWTKDNNCSYETNILKRMTEICKLQENVINNSENKTICFTGKMDYKRSEMEKLAKEKGYTPVDSVDKNLDILVCADINSNSSKLQKARKYGVKILNVVDFLK